MELQQSHTASQAAIHVLPKIENGVKLLCCLPPFWLAMSFTAAPYAKLGYGPRFHFARLFNLDGEANLPTLYSALLLATVSILLWLVGAAERNEGALRSRTWKWMSLVFALLVVDEICSFHEMAANPLRGFLELSGAWYFAWVIPGMLFVVVFVGCFANLLLSLPRRMALRMMLAGVVFVSGAIGMEMWSALYFVPGHHLEDARYLWAMSLEEVFEQLGLCLFAWTLVGYLKAKAPGLVLSGFDSPTG